MRYSSLLENFILIFVFSLTFGTILTAQLWIGEQIIFSHREGKLSGLVFAPTIATLLFTFCGVGTWLVNDVVLGFIGRPKTESERQNASIALSSSFITATPSLLLLAVIWMFCAFSRLNEFVIALLVFCTAIVSFWLTEGSKNAGIVSFYKSFISCSVVTVLATWLSVVLMTFLRQQQQQEYGSNGNKEEDDLFQRMVLWSFSSTSLENVLPLWWPAMIFMMTTSWSQVCRGVFAL